MSKGKTAIIENPRNHPMKVTALTSKGEDRCAYFQSINKVKNRMKTHSRDAATNNNIFLMIILL